LSDGRQLCARDAATAVVDAEIALVNGCSLRERERATVRVGASNAVLECLAIRAESVLVRPVDASEPIELRLPSGAGSPRP
jgi:hypothetical protein